MMIASAIAGMAGALYAFYTAAVEYDTWTRFAWTFWPFLIVIIGGAGNNLGVVVGTLFFTGILKGLEQVKFFFHSYVFFDVNWLQDLVFAALLISVLLVRPDGIIREKTTHTLPRGLLNKIAGSRAGRAVGDSPLDDAGPGRSRKAGIVRRLVHIFRRKNRYSANSRTGQPEE